jgi:hypothetical protein
MTKDPDLTGFELNIDTTAKKVATATSSLKAHAQTAGRLASLTAEKTKVANVSLPSAYYELAKQCYQTRSCEQDLPELFKELDAVTDAIGKNAMAKPPSTATTFTDKAKALAEKGVQVANKQKLAVQQKILLARLGKSAYEKHGVDAGPDALIKVIGSHTARLVVLEKELAVNLQKAGGKKRVMVILGGILVAFLFVGAMLGGGGGEQGEKAGSSSLLKTLSKGKSFSKKQMAQIYEKAKTLRLGMTAKQVVATLGQPTKSERTDFAADMRPKTPEAAELARQLNVQVPEALDTYGWSSKDDAGNSFVLVAIQCDEVMSIVVREGDAGVTFERDNPNQHYMRNHGMW